MPILSFKDKGKTYKLPARKARLAAQADVLVVGAGPSGIAAAVSAARTGAKTILIERYGFLGGNATAALVMPLLGFYTEKFFHEPEVEEAFRLFPADHYGGKPVIAGVVEEFVSRLIAFKGALCPSKKTGFVVPFDPEIFKLVALEMVDEAGVEMLFHALAIDVVKNENELEAVIFATKSGMLAVKAKVVVDATGDGDIAYFAGEEYELGRPQDGLTQPLTLMFQMAGFDPHDFHNYVRANPEQWMGVYGLWELINRATQEGKLDLKREDMLLFAGLRPREVTVNSTRVCGVSGVDVFGLSLAEYKSRYQMRQIAAFLKEYVPGFFHSFLLRSACQIGVRESRRVKGLYKLTQNDILTARKFSDVIARSSYPLDIHNPKGKGTVLKHLPENESYDIPLRCLIPAKIDRLITAGRCIWGSHEALSSYRVMAVCMATGQAAGVCAAVSVNENMLPRQVSAQKIQNILISQGADIHQNDQLSG